MKFENKLIKAQLVKRYKRFLADIILPDSSEVTAYCPNTGSMESCGQNGDIIYVSFHSDAKRKLKYTWELTKTKKGYICINTHRANQIVYDALQKKYIKELVAYEKIRKEMKFKDSRFDFFLSDHKTSKKNCWLEVKNVTLLKNNIVMFPDAVSVRAIKHLNTLSEIAKNGERAVILYLINRAEGDVFTVADHICKDYRPALQKARDTGVEILAYRSKNTPGQTFVFEKVAIEI